MKRIIVSAGCVALGAASLQAANDSGLSATERSKPWSMSASLKGFYDDNYVTRAEPFDRGSYGFEISPSIKLNLTGDMTRFSLGYTYGLRYYDDRVQDSADHSHNILLGLNHEFSERLKVDLSENFVVAQEPQLLDPSGIVVFPLRADGSNIRNTARGAFTAKLTPEFSVVGGYSNNYYDYDDSGYVGSFSALLDRMEHQASVNLRYQFLPSTTGVLVYQYGVVDYSSKDRLIINPLNTALENPNIRDNSSHTVLAGIDQRIGAKVEATVRVGATFVDYDNLNQSEASPSADLSLSYTYLPNSYFQIGVRHQRNQTDLAYTIGSALPTVDQETTAGYIAWTHAWTPKLSSTVMGTVQNSEFQGGGVDSLSDQVFTLGFNLSYQMSEFLAAEAGYNYDKLESDIAFRGYDRNRVHIGIRASY